MEVVDSEAGLNWGVFMKAHTGSPRKSRARKQTIGESLDHLDALLAHKSDNPFVQMVRWFFFYTDDAGRRSTHTHARHAH